MHVRVEIHSVCGFSCLRDASSGYMLYWLSNDSSVSIWLISNLVFRILVRRLLFYDSVEMSQYPQLLSADNALSRIFSVVIEFPPRIL